MPRAGGSRIRRAGILSLSGRRLTASGITSQRTAIWTTANTVRATGSALMVRGLNSTPVDIGCRTARAGGMKMRQAGIRIVVVD